MTKRTRNAIFYALCAVFVAAGTLVILYAQGWRVDFETLGFKKVGGIYLRSFPEDASVFINGEKIDKKPGFFDNGRFIGNLFPKNYKITLTSGGYLDWTEHVQVNPSFVSEIKYAILIPKNHESVATGTVKNFWADNGQLITGADNGQIFFKGNIIRGNKVTLQSDGSNIVLTENSSPKTYFINYLSDNAPTSTILNPKFIAYGIQPSNIKEIIKDPASNNQALFRTDDKIFSLDLRNGEISKLASSSSTISEMAASQSWIAWTNADLKTGKFVLTFYNRSSRSAQDQIDIAGKLTKLFFRNDNELGILQSDGGLYTISSGGQPQKLASDVRDFEFSPNGNKVAALENQALEIFAFNQDKDYWRFRLPEVEKIERIEWYGDENHIFIIYPDEINPVRSSRETLNSASATEKQALVPTTENTGHYASNGIKFLDLNDKNLENFSLVATGKQAHYDIKSNTLYFIRENLLKKIVFPK